MAWNVKNLELPDTLPDTEGIIRKETSQDNRFYLNYCTYGYSMVWWDWERWKQEIDWMALHGINMPLMVLGEEAVWQNTLKQLNYSDEEIKEYIAGPAFLPWWLMGNLEGWGGPLPQSWIDQQIELRQKIQQRMEAYGMKPVFQGFYGMVPNSLIGKFPDANIPDLGKWTGGFKRPAFLSPTDSLFKEISTIYYEEQKKLFGVADFYAGDPFHEGGNIEGVDLRESGTSIFKAMQKANEGSKWVIQAWQANPRQEMIDHLNTGDIIILDLWSEVLPQWGDPDSQWFRKEGFGKHQWIWCNLLNFGGNVGMYGKMEKVIQGWELSNDHLLGVNKTGVGATMEGIENNPIMYELLYELPWRNEGINLNEWLNGYCQYRYGQSIQEVEKVWKILSQTAYACKRYQEGVTESVLCARPALEVPTVSSWGGAVIYYDTDYFEEAWPLLLSAKDQLGHLDTYNYDLADYTRQVLANRANVLLKQIAQSYSDNDLVAFNDLSDRFLQLILDQDKLLATQPGFMLGPWLDAAKKKGQTKEEKALYEWNARTIITTWGDQLGSETLHEYSHREWSGLLMDFYYPRWKMFFEAKKRELQGEIIEPIDYYTWEEEWTKKTNSFPTKPVGNTINIVTELFEKYKK